MQVPNSITKAGLLVWVLGVSSYAIAIINRSSFAALGPTAQEYFGVEATVLSSFAVMQLVLYVLMQIPVGIFIHRFGPTRVILAGATLMLIGQTALALSTSVWMVIGARVLVGIGDAGTFISVLRLLAHWFPARQLPVWSQLTSQLGQIGQIIAIVPLAFIVSTRGWSAGFLTAAGVTLLVASASFVFMRDAPSRPSSLTQLFQRPVQVTTDTGTLRHTSLIADLAAQFRTLPGLLRMPGVRLAFWVHLTPPFSLTSFALLWGYPFLTGAVGLDRPAAASLISLSVIGSMGVALSLGPLSARFATRRVEMSVGVVVAIMAVWSAVLLWPGSPPPWLLIVLVLVMAAGYPASMLSFDVLRQYAPPKQISVATGFVNTGGFIASLFTIFAVGLLLDLQGAGSPATYSDDAFTVAMAAQFICWSTGLFFIWRESRLVRHVQPDKSSS